MPCIRKSSVRIHATLTWTSISFSVKVLAVESPCTYVAFLEQVTGLALHEVGSICGHNPHILVPTGSPALLRCLRDVRTFVSKHTRTSNHCGKRSFFLERTWKFSRMLDNYASVESGNSSVHARERFLFSFPWFGQPVFKICPHGPWTKERERERERRQNHTFTFLSE